MDKVFIGTPIRDIKGYALDRWIASVNALDWDNLELCIVDNSDDAVFSEMVKEKITAKVIHLPNMSGKENEKRLALSREEFRKEFLKSDALYWFSWEADIILPPNALKELMRFIPEFDIVNHYYPDRDNPAIMEECGIGCSLFKRKILEDFNFSENGGYAFCDPLMPQCYYGGDSYLIRRILRAGHKMVDLHNVLNISHLDK